MSANRLSLAIDVGGTNTRACYGDDEEFRKISSFVELKSFILDLTNHIKPDACTIGFAGPVVSRSEVCLSNWPGNPMIRISDLYDWGLPRGSTLMLNDMEAGAYGVISIGENKPAVDTDRICLYPGNNPDHNRLSGNKILLTPGTGLGTIGIVSVEAESGETIEDPVASEIQHSAAFALDAIHGNLISWLSENRCAGGMPSWEDFVSGRGLVNIYEGLGADTELEHTDREEDMAAWIAANGVADSNEGCVMALDIYYRCLAKVAQQMALTFQPYGGIYLSGDSTVRNLSFIQKSKFISELQDNRILDGLLKRFPVYIITQKELNIRGALWACRKRIHLAVN